MTGMTRSTLSLQHERIDDIPLLLGVIEQLRLPEILQRHLGTHHLHQGLGNGTLAAAWLAFLLSEADHRKSSVQEWARQHQHTLQTLLQQPLRPAEFSDDRLGIVLTRLDQADWAAVEADLWQASCEVYAIPAEGIRLDSTSSFGYHQVTTEGLLQYGHSKDHRPDLPQLKLMAAVAQPTSCPIACDVIPGNRADDILYLPLIERVRTQLRQSGLLYMGDCKMAALGIRADIADHGDFYLTVLPRTGDNARLIDAWITETLAKEETLQAFDRPRKSEDEERVPLAKAREFQRRCQATVGGKVVTWTERVQLVRTEALAEHHGEQLERRLREAETDLRHLTPAVGRGHRQYREEGTLREAVAQTLKEYDVEGLLEVSYRREEYGVVRPKKDASGAEPRVRYAITEVRRVGGAIAVAKARYGWRVQVTNAPAGRCDLLGAILLYNGGWSVERDWHLLKDRPLGIQPLDVRKEDQIGGLTKLLLVALRVLTFIEVVVRGRLAESGETLSGLYEGQPSRQTSRPTAVRLLRAVARLQMTVSCVALSGQSHWLLTPLPRLLEQILTLLGLPRDTYMRLASDTG